MNVRIIPQTGMSMAAGQFPATPPVFLLLGGDRLSCCDEAVVAEDDSDAVVGMCTIAPHGEGHNGQPTIVGVYVRPDQRGRGLGKQLFRAALMRCQERGLTPVRVDVMSTGMHKIIEDLSEEEKSLLVIHDQGRIFDFLPG